MSGDRVGITADPDRPADPRLAFKPGQGEIPTSPGVYRFSDKYGRVLYIGKAKNLRARLANYFQPMHALMPRTRRMVSLAAHLDWTVVATDTESLVLEHTWITEFKPPFNVQFKDDKTYPYLAVTLREEAPRLIITRNEKIKGARYFGPYPKVWALKETAGLLQQAFPIRTCNDADYKRAMQSGRPCLAGQIGRCHGPCSGLVSVQDHRARVDELVSFLAGGDSHALQRLRRAMAAAAAEQRYEDAARLRDQATAVEHVLEKNAIVLGHGVDLDVFGLRSDDLAAAVHQFMIRGGRIRGERSWIVDVELDDSPSTLLEQVLQSAYDISAGNDGAGEPPAEILVPEPPADAPQLEAALAERRPRKGRVRIRVPERGDKAQLMERAVLNAGEHLTRYKMKRAADITSRTDALAELQQALGMDDPPLRIECIDVSHLQGTGVVASLVVFEDGLPAKGAYRKYRIEHTTDDTDSIHQVVSRRAAQLNAAREAGEQPTGVYRDRPQLIIVDGGEPQVKAAARALAEAGIDDVALCGIAKRLEEIWLPDDPFPVILPRTSESLFLVQRVRDEAHRFAITFQRQRRSTSIASRLSEISGLGPKRVQGLLKHFGSVARLKQATAEELASAPGVGPRIAAQIRAELNTAGDTPAAAGELDPGRMDDAQQGAESDEADSSAPASNREDPA